MRTNLSRYTVAFSDLSWESVFDSQDVPMFPQAWQVGMYLEEYVERYIPSGVIRLGHTVVQTVRRDAERRWTVKWVLEGFVPLLFRLFCLLIETNKSVTKKNNGR